MGPETIMGSMVLGMFTDPEGHLIGLIQSQLPSAEEDIAGRR